jgi:hypothetical protein
VHRADDTDDTAYIAYRVRVRVTEHKSQQLSPARLFISPSTNQCGCQRVKNKTKHKTKSNNINQHKAAHKGKHTNQQTTTTKQHQ